MKKILIIFLVLFFFSFVVYAEQTNYKTYSQLVRSFKQLAATNSLSFKKIGKSYSGKNIYVLKIGNDTNPAVFVGANISGFDIPASESALLLSKYLIAKFKSNDKKYKDRCFYIIPSLNPELYNEYFKKPLFKNPYNLNPTDNDGDGLIDEDPPEDLNKDGFITIMRVKAVDGRYIEDKGFPYKLRKADPVKGERGIYKYYTEGIDNDGDGKFNEDGIGGVKINNNFPFLFKYNNKLSGLYPVSEKTTKAILDFILKHKNIELAYIIDKTNNLIKLPELGRTAKLGDAKVKVPKRFGKFLGIDTNKKYTLKELVKIINEMGLGGGMKVTESMVASFLGVSPPASIDADDYKYYKALSEEYKKIAKKDKINIKRESKREEDGSLIKWFYFNAGIMAIGVDTWALPKPTENKKSSGLTLEKLKKMSSEEFLKLDDKVLKDFFKQFKFPPQFNIKMIKGMIKSGRVTPKKMVGFIEKYKSKKKSSESSGNKTLKNYIENILKGRGVIKWQKFNHPQLGEVEIGGIVPFVEDIPPYSKVKENSKLINDTFDLLLKKLPNIKFEGLKIKKEKTGAYRVSFFIVNEGYLPFYFNMAKRNKYSMPILISLNLPKDSILVEGKKLVKADSIGGLGSYKKVEYLIIPGKHKKIKVKISNERIKDIVKTIDLGGVK